MGLTRTGRVITAAALIVSISFAALAAAHVAFMRMFGVGLTLAILVDATIIRTVLVPALMHLAGRLNWWAPKPVARLHHWIGLSESPTRPPDAVDEERQAMTSMTESSQWVIGAGLADASRICEPVSVSVFRPTTPLLQGSKSTVSQ